MTVVDTSAVVDLLLGSGVASRVGELVRTEGSVAAPDVVVFETMAVLRRMSLRGDAPPDRLRGAVDDLADLPIVLYPSVPLRTRAWELRENLTVGDALFLVLAEQLGEPLATKDAGLAVAAERHSAVVALRLV